jgi:hypothetical protein
MKLRMTLIGGAVLLTALTRLLPHPPNFTPVCAMGLFGAAFLPNLWAAFLVPLAAMFLSDCGLELGTRLGWFGQGGWLGHGGGFYSGMLLIYLAIVLVTAVGLLLRRHRNVFTVSGCVLVGSILFFLVSNFAVWTTGTLYPQTLSGLITCYIAGLPFFQWTLLGDAFYALVLFGGYALIERSILARGTDQAAPALESETNEIEPATLATAGRDGSK